MVVNSCIEFLCGQADILFFAPCTGNQIDDISRRAGETLSNWVLSSSFGRV